MASLADAAMARSARLGRDLHGSVHCALTEEFPLAPPPPRVCPPARKRAAHQGAERLHVAVVGSGGAATAEPVILAVAGGSGALASSCGLLRTAGAQGWQVYVGVMGRWPGLLTKFVAARRLVEHVGNGRHPPGTPLVFVDATDVLVQGPPAIITRELGGMREGFIWSAEDQCFPLGGWPYNLGLGPHVCELFPRPCADHVPAHNRWVNSGGWVGTAAAANRTLAQLHAAVARRAGPCIGRPADQYLANTNFLRERAQVGIDTDARIFAAGATKHVLRWHGGAGRAANGSTSAAPAPLPASGKPGGRFCFPGSGGGACPPILHFNGRATAKGYWTTASVLKVMEAAGGTPRRPERMPRLINLDEKGAQPPAWAVRSVEQCWAA
jgi:hypothetical protein